MNEFVKINCACDLGYDKGAIKKTIENNIFTIFGNLNQKNSIIIRYHGPLTENNLDNSTTFNMFFYFDDRENDKKIIPLKKCSKCDGICYCATIDLDLNHRINFGFFDQNENYELNTIVPFKLDIKPDPISNIMQRYGFEQNTYLPVCEDKKDNLFSFKNILNTIKGFFSKLSRRDCSIS